jgi:hypothetical protein
MIAAHIELILIVTGAVTASMLIQFIAPKPVMRLVFGTAPTDPVSLTIARHWGLLIALLGALLVYAAFDPPLRGPVILVALVEKVVFVAFMLSPSIRQRGLAAMVGGADLLMSIVYAHYLAGF